MRIIEITHIQDLKNGEWFKLKPEAKKVYEKIEYDRQEKKYCCQDLSDISKLRYFKKNTIVWLDFEY